MKSHSKSDAHKVVIAALLGNLGIAVAKFVAAWLSGSAAILAEGVHSLADTGNQGLLLLGMSLAKRQRPELYPLGRDKEAYFWAFIVALLLFFMGGVFAVYEGIHKLLGPDEPQGSAWIPLGVLLVSLMYNGPRVWAARQEQWKLLRLLGAEGVILPIDSMDAVGQMGGDNREPPAAP